jgi:hypothetical protein
MRGKNFEEWNEERKARGWKKSQQKALKRMYLIHLC